jgi:hypothetical protein
MATQQSDPEPGRRPTRRELVVLLAARVALASGFSIVVAAGNAGNPVLAVGVLMVGIAVVFALIGYAVAYVLRMP